MTVGVNLLWCRPGEVGGSEEYLARQLAGLAELDLDELDMTLFVLPAYPAAHADLAERFDMVRAPTDGRRRGLRVAVEHTWLAARTRERRLQLVHHGGGTMPRGLPAAGVLTVHDLQYLAYPRFFSRLKLTWLATAVPTSVRRAAAVTVPSEFVKGTVVSSFGYPADRVIVVPHGLEGGVGAGPLDEPALRTRYRLPGRFVLYPAITHPHKNHVLLVRAFAGLDGDDRLRLVLLGGAGAADEEVSAEIERLGVGARVVRPGRVPDADRDGLYRLASVTAFPSLYEGFGAPVLEAMALGSPVVAADSTALPEVVGAAGVLVDPFDQDAWSDALAHLLSDEAEQARFSRLGRSRARAFTAVGSARALLDAYRLALA
ncbi:MAG TPA: glycosyltransferase family 1 protein [Acidimicrobiales bacterium]|nr:glycosyltransferase family 1 protein [Acidimicrobiales bacterium]